MIPAVVFAPMRVEQAALRRARTPVVHAGMGPARSRRTVAALDTARLDVAGLDAAGAGTHGVVVAGLAGGLAVDVRPGDVVVATEVRGAGRTRTCPGAPPLAAHLRRLGLTVHLGPIASTERVATGAARRALAATGALAVDTESAWLAPEAGRPFAVVRVVVDTADAPLLHPLTPARGLRALRTLARAVPAIDAWVAALRPRAVTPANPRSLGAGVELAVDVTEAAGETENLHFTLPREVS